MYHSQKKKEKYFPYSLLLKFEPLSALEYSKFQFYGIGWNQDYYIKIDFDTKWILAIYPKNAIEKKSIWLMKDDKAYYYFSFFLLYW